MIRSIRSLPAGVVACCVLGLASRCLAIGQAKYVETAKQPNDFAIVDNKTAATIYVDSNDFWGVGRAAKDLQADIERVSGISPALVHSIGIIRTAPIIIGTIGKSAVIDQLIQSGKIDAKQITGKWESYFTQVVQNPLPNVASALVIVGSDKRATIYGIYDLSEEMGVSPWYWWADVPTKHSDSLFVKPGKYQQGEPSVKYRGIFLNDEAPDLSNWVHEKFGTVPLSTDPPIPANIANYDHKFYTRLFELILRIRGNYLWPAMWNNAFNEDDPDNAKLADGYGIVMGTSHQEPMLRAQKEWDRRYQRTIGTWNYYKNPDVLEKFWSDGVTRNKNYESILTIGLRGANDTEMIPGGTIQQSMDLLGKIITVQRKIISEQVNPDPTKVPQLWCPYKEVLDYYNAGFRVPDDVTILWAEDNWGNVRRLPTADERKRSGGAGIYYHFDYHGGPRNYQWINSSPISKVYDQMSLAKKYGADRVWIVNVGHFKGQEFPTEYFMNLGWNTDADVVKDTDEFTRVWAEREFGSTYAADIADIISKYTMYNNRRKPELLEPDTYSLVNYQEADTVVADYNAIVTRAEKIFAALPEDQRNAFYELVLFPAKASAQVNEMYVDAGKNALYANQGRASANDMAEQTQKMFKADADLTDYFNTKLADGKWNHFMDQLHIGYTSWNEPRQNTIPQTQQIQLQNAGEMGVAVEGSTSAWPGGQGDATLAQFDAFNQQKHYIDVFNKGKAPFDFEVSASAPWITLSETKGTADKEKRIWVSVDWSKAPVETTSGVVTISRSGSGSVPVKVEAFKPASITRDSVNGFVEGEGYVSIEAEHFTKKIDAGDLRWEKLPDYGRTLSAMRAVASVDAASPTPPQNAPCLEYQMYIFHPGQVKTYAVVSPTLNFVPDRGLRVGISMDDSPPQIVTLVPQGFSVQNGNREWEESVKNSARIAAGQFTLAQPGYHTLKIWMVDPAVDVEKLIVDTGGLKASYLGPPESYHH